MEGHQVHHHDTEYQDLISRLERANDSLSYYKNTKEICMRDLQKLELENSALAEENNYLKKRIKNVERNMNSIHEKTLDPDRSHDYQDSISSKSRPHNRYSSVRSTLPPLNTHKNFDNISTTSATNRPNSNIRHRMSTVTIGPKRQLDVYEKAYLWSLLIYRV